MQFECRQIRLRSSHQNGHFFCLVNYHRFTILNDNFVIKIRFEMNQFCVPLRVKRERKKNMDDITYHEQRRSVMLCGHNNRTLDVIYTYYMPMQQRGARIGPMRIRALSIDYLFYVIYHLTRAISIDSYAKVKLNLPNSFHCLRGFFCVNYLEK